MNADTLSAHHLLTLSSFVIIWTLEKWLPTMRQQHRVRHAVRNLSLGLLNALLASLLTAPLILLVIHQADKSGFGLLRMMHLPALLTMVLAIVLMDGWMYLWHRGSHQLSFLWRFHQVHHSDTDMDATTAVRFHTGEILISGWLRLVPILLLGITPPQLLLYETLLMPVIVFHHSNCRFPERCDRVLRLLLTTPAMHRVHHSPVRVETDSNYASVFSFWDRLGKTFRLQQNAKRGFGLNEFVGAEREGIGHLILMPFRHLTETNYRK